MSRLLLLCVFLGFCSVVAGMAMIFVPAGFIVAGLALIAAGLLVDDGADETG